MLVQQSSNASQQPVGMLTLSKLLISGMSAEALANVKFGQAIQKHEAAVMSMVNDESDKADQMAKLAPWMTVLQVVAGVVGVATGAAAFFFGGPAATAAAFGASEAVGAGIEAAVTAVDVGVTLGAGATSFANSRLEAGIQTDGALQQAATMCAKTDATMMTTLSEGIGQIGAAISSMTRNDGSVGAHKFI